MPILCDKRTPGAHWLTFEGPLEVGEAARLTAAIALAKRSGADMFELVCPPINGMGPEETANAVLEGGMNTVSWCRFYVGEDAKYMHGDPLGVFASSEDARQVFEADILFIQALRAQGLEVRHVTGPGNFVLGAGYKLNRAEKRRKILAFERQVVPIAADAGLQINREYLQPGEDGSVGAEPTIGSMEEMKRLVEEVAHESYRIHADAFHMLRCGEVPHEAIEVGGNLIGYFHSHGRARLPAGAFHLPEDPELYDDVHWHLVSCAMDEQGIGDIPIVPEGFGQKALDAIPPLNQNVCKPIEPGRHCTLSFEHLSQTNVL